MEITITELEKITCITAKTIRKKLANTQALRIDGLKKYYDSSIALAAIYLNDNGKDKLLLDQERARLAKAQTERVELETRFRKEELVNANELVELYSKKVVAFKNRFLAIPKKIAAQFRSFQTPSQIEDHGEKLVYEALKELSLPEVEDANPK